MKYSIFSGEFRTNQSEVIKRSDYRHYEMGVKYNVFHKLKI